MIMQKLEAAAGIDAQILTFHPRMRGPKILQWAWRRITTLREDISLSSMFDVYLPVTYGERRKVYSAVLAGGHIPAG